MRAVQILFLCMGAALICAFAFVVMLRLSLRPTDWAYGLPQSGVFADPFIFNGAVFGGVFFGLTSFPFAYYTLRKLRLPTAASFVFGAVLAEILIVTPIAGWFAVWTSIPALVTALLVCKYSGWRIFERNP